MLYHVVSCGIMPCCMVWCPVVLCCVVSCCMVSCRIVSSRIVLIILVKQKLKHWCIVIHINIKNCYSYCVIDFKHIIKTNRLDSLVHVKLRLIFSALLILISLNLQRRFHTTVFVHVTDIRQSSSDRGGRQHGPLTYWKYCITTSLDTETVPLKRGPFTRIITFF